MTWKTHLVGGIQAGVILAAATGADPKTAVIEIGASALGSLLPDIDHPKSKISQSDILLMITSEGISKITKHRREVHTVWASFLFAAIAFIFFKISMLASVTGGSFIIGLILALGIDMMGGRIGSIIGIGYFLLAPQFISFTSIPFDIHSAINCSIAIFVGCISHLIYDSANKQGIMWLYPFKKKRYHYLNIQTTSREEDYFFFAMFFLAIAMIVVFNPFGTQYIYNIFHAVNASTFNMR